MECPMALRPSKTNEDETSGAQPTKLEGVSTERGRRRATSVDPLRALQFE